MSETPHPNILTTHVLDTARGCPASGLKISIYRNDNEDEDDFAWQLIGETMTNSDGRGPDWIPSSTISTMRPGIFKAVFHTQEYFDRTGTPNFYPQVDIIFRIADVTQHYHIPLNLSPYGYSTYRGS